MSYRRFLDPDTDYTVSNAELKIQAEIYNKECWGMTTQKRFCLLTTTADFYFSDINLAVYIDGEQSHKNRQERDTELRRLLKKRHGCKIRSYSYKTPITKKRLKEIVEDIVDNVVGYRRDSK